MIPGNLPHCGETDDRIPRHANPLSARELVRLTASECDVLRGFLPAGAPALTAACSGLSSPGLSFPGALTSTKSAQAGTTGQYPT